MTCLQFSNSYCHETHSTIYNIWFDLIKKKHFIAHKERKSVALIITNNKNSIVIIFATKYERLIPPYQITFFLAFGQSKIFFSHRILLNILIYVLFFDKKEYLAIFRTEKHFKTRKEHVLIKRLFNKVLPYLLHCKDMVKPYYIKGVHRVKKHLFAHVLQSSCSWKFCKIHRKTPVLESLFSKVARTKRVHHKCFPMSCFF